MKFNITPVSQLQQSEEGTTLITKTFQELSSVILKHLYAGNTVFFPYEISFECSLGEELSREYVGRTSVFASTFIFPFSSLIQDLGHASLIDLSSFLTELQTAGYNVNLRHEVSRVERTTLNTSRIVGISVSRF